MIIVGAEEEKETVTHQPDLTLDCKSAVLMEQSTGRILYEQNPDEPLPPASVTKVMTLLLVMEAIDDGKLHLTDQLQVSENAASMGGSQVFLEPGENMSLDDLLKSVVVSSANDAAVTLAENVAGSVESFVEKMNAKAKELGMENTNFENVTGLDDNVTNHVTSARDIAIMSKALMEHPLIFNYTNIWMDTIRNGQFGLTNTNRLIRFYNGANGLKTGSTSKAKFCISAAAKRDGMQLIAVVMASPTRDIRNECAKKLLDYGFANYAVANFEADNNTEIKVIGGSKDTLLTSYPSISLLTGKGEASKIEKKIEIPEEINAPVNEGDVIGKVVYSLDGNEIGSVEIRAVETVKRISYGGVLYKLIKKVLFC